MIQAPLKVLWRRIDYLRMKRVPISEAKTFTEFVDYWHEMPVIQKDEEPDLEDKHKYGWCRTDENGEVIELIRRTNPNAKWDYWRTVGSAAFKLKSGARKIGDAQAPKGDIDFDGMREESIRKDMEIYDRVQNLKLHTQKLCAIRSCSWPIINQQ